MAGCALTWIGTAGMLAWAGYDDYRATQAVRARNAELIKQQRENLVKWTQNVGAGKMQPVPDFRIPSQYPDDYAKRQQRQRLYQSIRSKAKWGLLFTSIVGLISPFLLALLPEKWRDALGVLAHDKSGSVVGLYVKQGWIFVARQYSDPSSPAVEIDGKRSIVVFRNLVFETEFAGNAAQRRVEVPFSGIIGTVVSGSLMDSSTLIVRTTSGRVTISDKIKPFEILHDLLEDIVDLNQKNQEKREASLAAEPKVHTPWYGWLALASAVGAVVYAGWKFMYAE